MRPCIQYQMKRCSAPCAGLISRGEYKKIIDEVILFLKGEKRELLHRLEERMQRLAGEMRFEDAAKIRDRIFKLQRAFESQKVVSPELGDIDVIGYYREGDDIAVNVLFVRNGTLIGAKDFFLEKVLTSDNSEMMHSVTELFYAKEIIPPEVILVNAMPESARPLKAWLKKKKGGSVNIEAPSDRKKGVSPKSRETFWGKGMELLHMANENARLHYASSVKRRASSVNKDEFFSFDAQRLTLVAQRLKGRLHLTKVPSSIGAFDVSTIQGSESVGAFIYWENGEFKKDNYRHLRIKGVLGVDDYAMMHEIVERVLRKEHLIPDLVVIDGGKGQLKVARKVMGDLDIKTDLIAVAKKPDRAFVIRRQTTDDRQQTTDKDYEVIDLEDRSSSSLLLKKIRDEVHRFAISFHRKLRDKRLMESLLQRIPGIGKKRRLELLRHFGSIDNIRKATVDEIAKIKGFNKKVAEKVIEGLQP
jgi:excinuclease ABC subunit C